MSRTLPAGAGSDLDRALTMFDEALGLIETMDPVPAGQAAGPALPLPSLLDQCEDVLAGSAQPQSGLRVLYSFPGLDLTSAAFWTARVPGVQPVVLATDLPGPWAAVDPASNAPLGLSPDLRRHALTAALGALQSDLARIGRDALVIVQPGDTVPDPAPDPAPLAALALCHPLHAYRSYLIAGTRGGASLERFCNLLSAFLDAVGPLPSIRFDMDGSTSQEMDTLCRVLHLPALRPDRAAGPTLARADQDPLAGITPADLAAVPAYQALCTRLGYEPGHLPARAAPEGAAHYAVQGRQRLLTGTGGTGRAQISAFLVRMERVFDQLAPAAATRPDGAALTEALDEVFALGDHQFLERLDTYLDSCAPAEAALTLFAAAAHLQPGGQGLHALSLIFEGLSRMPAGLRWLQVLGASLLVDANQMKQAFATLIGDALTPDMLPAATLEQLQGGVADLNIGTAAIDHGHALLLQHLKDNPPPRDGRRRVMVEIGTTRETIPGQGSTQKLAAFCAETGIEFVTVDMDPRNGRQATRMFRRNSYPFQAITSKGEDYLAAYEGQIDYIFLDAYDFDHGMHTALRQSRYETYLGARIDEEACHKMHLDCAMSLLDKLAPDGLICFDDTWQDDSGAWTAKGTTAMPFLLENGFAVLEARNRAALLARPPAQGEQTQG